MAIKTHIRRFHWALWALMLSLAACAGTIPPEKLTGVDHGISFQSLSHDPEAFVGRTVLLGGAIILTENLPQKTRLVVLQHDLDEDLRPLSDDRSRGRFMVMVPEFLDPAIYTKGRRITIVGKVTGKETRQLNEIPYVYPVIEEQYRHLWPVENSYDSVPRVQFGIGIGIGGYGF